MLNEIKIKDKITRFILICENLKIDPSISSFIDRKRFQKIFYLLKKFGLDFNISYTWHKHGPYSPQLTEIYYQVESFKKLEENIESPLNEKDRYILEYSKPFFTPIIDEAEKLEYYASILFIKHDMIFFDSNKNEETIENKVAKLKSNLYNPQSYKEALKILKKYKLA